MTLPPFLLSISPRGAFLATVVVLAAASWKLFSRGIAASRAGRSWPWWLALGATVASLWQLLWLVDPMWQDKWREGQFSWREVVLLVAASGASGFGVAAIGLFLARPRRFGWRWALWCFYGLCAGPAVLLLMRQRLIAEGSPEFWSLIQAISAAAGVVLVLFGWCWLAWRRRRMADSASSPPSWKQFRLRTLLELTAVVATVLGILAWDHQGRVEQAIHPGKGWVDLQEVQALGAEGELIAALRRDIEGTDAERRRHAVSTLSELESRGWAVLCEYLAADLHRQDVEAGLLEWPRGLSESLCANLRQHSNPVIRRSAYRAMLSDSLYSGIHGLARKVVADWAEAAFRNDPDAGVRTWAGAALAAAAPEKLGAVRPVLRQLLKDSNPKVRFTIVVLCRKCAAHAAALLPELLTMLSDDDTDVRAQATVAIAEVAPAQPEVTEVLLALLQSSDMSHRAASALWTVSDKTGVVAAAVIAALENPAKQQREAAEHYWRYAPAAIPAAALPAVRIAMKMADDDERTILLDLLRHLDPHAPELKQTDGEP